MVHLSGVEVDARGVFVQGLVDGIEVYLIGVLATLGLDQVAVGLGHVGLHEVVDYSVYSHVVLRIVGGILLLYFLVAH